MKTPLVVLMVLGWQLSYAPFVDWLRCIKVYSGYVNASWRSSSHGVLPAYKWLCHASHLTCRRHIASAVWCWQTTPVYPQYASVAIFSNIYVCIIPKYSLQFPRHQISWVSEWLSDWLIDSVCDFSPFVDTTHYKFRVKQSSVYGKNDHFYKCRN